MPVGKKDQMLDHSIKEDDLLSYLREKKVIASPFDGSQFKKLEMELTILKAERDGLYQEVNNLKKESFMLRKHIAEIVDSIKEFLKKIW